MTYLFGRNLNTAVSDVIREMIDIHPPGHRWLVMLREIHLSDSYVLLKPEPAVWSSSRPWQGVPL
jgi:hypothetical protein